MKRSLRILTGAMILAVVGAVAAPDEARGRRTYGGRSKSSIGARSVGGSRGVARSTGARYSRGVASGRAYYGRGFYGGYGYGGYYRYPFWGYRPYYWGYPSFAIGFGFYHPYYLGATYWGWPYYAPTRDRVVVLDPSDSRGFGALETDVKPGGADVLVDGIWVGKARDYNGRWDQLYLATGQREIEFQRRGYQSLRFFVDVRRGGYTHIEERLQKGDGLDARSDPPPEPVRPVGATMREPQQVETRERRLGDPGETGARVLTVEPIEGSEPRRDGDSRPPSSIETGYLKIVVVPGDAMVYLDGEFLASGDELRRLHGSLPVAAGRHTIEVARPGYKTRKLKVAIDPDRTREVRIDLEEE